MLAWIAISFSTRRLIQPLMSYGVGYDSDQSYSPAFATHVNGLLELLLNEKGIREARILEVGSGKGTFLRSLVEAPGVQNTGWGFDQAMWDPKVISMDDYDSCDRLHERVRSYSR